MKEPCEKCKALFQMRIGELEKRMDTNLNNARDGSSY